MNPKVWMEKLWFGFSMERLSLSEQLVTGSDPEPFWYQSLVLGSSLMMTCRHLWTEVVHAPNTAATFGHEWETIVLNSEPGPVKLSAFRWAGLCEAVQSLMFLFALSWRDYKNTSFELSQGGRGFKEERKCLQRPFQICGCSKRLLIWNKMGKKQHSSRATWRMWSQQKAFETWQVRRDGAAGTE